MALESYALTSVLDVQQYMKRDSINFEFTEKLIMAATQFIEIYCNRRFCKTVYTNELYDGDGTRILFLKNFPIVSIESIYYTYVNFADTLIDSDTYKPYNEGGYVYKISNWIRGNQNIKINYTAGYDFDLVGIPPEIKDICNGLVSMRYDANEKLGIEAERMGGYSVNYSKEALPESMRKRLEMWRKLDVI